MTMDMATIHPTMEVIESNYEALLFCNALAIFLYLKYLCIINKKFLAL